MTDISTAVVSGPQPDGRNRRSARTKEAVLFACRLRMKGGEFQPSMLACCRDAGVSMRSGFQHFTSIETLRHVALDTSTGVEIMNLIWGGDEWKTILRGGHFTRFVKAAVFGRLL